MRLLFPLAWKHLKIDQVLRHYLVLKKKAYQDDNRSSTLNFLLHYLNLKGVCIHKGVCFVVMKLMLLTDFLNTIHLLIIISL